MTYSSSCQRIRIGGTISGSTLSGGTLMETHGRNFLSWDGLLGWPGKRGLNKQLLGQDGTKHRKGKPYRERLMTLALVAYDRDDDGLITLNGRMDHLEDNIDLMMELLTPLDDEQIILERTTHLGSSVPGEEEAVRWIRVEAQEAASFARGPVFGIPHASYGITVPVIAAYPFWQSETLHSHVVNGSNVIVPNGGTARDSAAIYEFAGDGTLTHNDDDTSEMVVSGSSGVVTVDMSNPEGSTIMEGGVRADRRMTPKRRHWFRLRRGDNDLTSTVAVTIKHRDQHLT